MGSSGAVFAAIDIAARPGVLFHHGLGGNFNVGRGNSARSEKANSFIYESFRNDPTENEVDRILKVLDKLGEPASVVSARMPEAMVTMGKKKKLPFYIVTFSLILTGWLTAVIMIVRIFSPGFLDPWIDIYPLVSDPTFNTVIYIFGALLIAALGLGLLWLGARMMRGVRFVFRFLFEKVRNWRKRAPVPTQ